MTREEIRKEYSPALENLLLILTDIQNSNDANYLSKEDMIWVAEYLGITLATVYGVVKYYTLFSSQPRGRHLIRLCKSPVCNMLEVDKITQALESLLLVKEGEVSIDGKFSYEKVACLGQCEKAPSMMINDRVHGHLTIQKIEKIITTLRNSI